MVPEEMRGVWQRRSIAVDDGAPGETADVLWLQAAEAFADLRVPRATDGRVEAFAGATTWDPPRLTWHHTIDWNGGFSGYDCGDVEWRDGALVERGTFDDAGTTRDYEEVWDRVDPGAEYEVFAADSAILVRIGPYALALHDGRATGSTFDVRAARWSPELGWHDTHGFGAGLELPFPGDVHARPGWTITESSAPQSTVSGSGPAPAPR